MATLSAAASAGSAVRGGPFRPGPDETALDCGKGQRDDGERSAERAYAHHCNADLQKLLLSPAPEEDHEGGGCHGANPGGVRADCGNRRACQARKIRAEVGIHASHQTSRQFNGVRGEPERSYDDDQEKRAAVQDFKLGVQGLSAQATPTRATCASMR